MREKLERSESIGKLSPSSSLQLHGRKYVTLTTLLPSFLPIFMWWCWWRRIELWFLFSFGVLWRKPFLFYELWNLRLCSKLFFDKTNFWENIAYPMLYLFELSFFWYQDRVIRSSVAQDMNDTVREVKTARQQDLRTLQNFYKMLYLVFGLKILNWWTRHSTNHVRKVLEFSG